MAAFQNEIILFLVSILATWRLSAMLSYEAGLFNMFLALREFVGITHDDNGEKIASNGSFFADLLDCMWCLSVWIGGAVAVSLYFYPVLVYLLLPFALSAGAVLVEKWARD